MMGRYRYHAQIGERFGQLTVTAIHDEPDALGRYSVRTRCDCGFERDHFYSDLRYGRATRCRKCAFIPRQLAALPAKLAREADQAARRAAIDTQRADARADRRATVVGMICMGMTRADIARALHLDPSTVSKIIKGER